MLVMIELQRRSTKSNDSKLTEEEIEMKRMLIMTVKSTCLILSIIY